MDGTLKRKAGICTDLAIRWVIAVTGITFFSLLYLLLGLPMFLCQGCEYLFGRNRKQSDIN